MVVSDPVAARSLVCSVRFYAAIAMEMAAAILKHQSFVNQTLMESMTLMLKRAKKNSMPFHWYSQMKRLISR